MQKEEIVKNISDLTKNESMKDVKVIGFDADDTLWINETYYQEAEMCLCELLKDYSHVENITKELFRIEIDNMNIYGYGVKAFTLSMIETALTISKNLVSPSVITEVIKIGKGLLNKPVELLDNVENTLKMLKGNYNLIIATKGDLLDQQRKVEKSGIKDYFKHIEIMHDKNENEYNKLLKQLKIEPKEFLMVGNSLKSDILPVIKIGAKAIHIPYHITWEHEKIESFNQLNHHEIKDFAELITLLN